MLTYPGPENRRLPRKSYYTEKIQMGKNVIVIGAGAAGLMAAAAAAENGNTVTVLEKNEKAGKKIYITGKGRCNLTNDCATEDFFGHVVRNHKFLYSAIYGFDHDMVRDFFEKNGCPVKVERGNRVFPVSDHASDVTATLLRRLSGLGVRILYHTEVLEILMEPAGGPEAEKSSSKKPAAGQPAAVSGAEKQSAPEKKTADRPVRKVCGVLIRGGRKMPADAVILCTGGLSYPSTGSTGDGLKMAEKAGLAVMPAAPSLVPFETKEQWCRDLQGLALKNTAIRVYPIPEIPEEDHPDKTQPAESGKKKKKKKEKPVYEAFGELLFTHFGLSGPVILTASCYCDFQKHPRGFRLFMDLKPALSQEQLVERIRREFTDAPNRHLPGAVRPLFPARLAEAVTELSGLGTERRAAAFTGEEIEELASLIKKIPVTITGTRGFQEAIVTRGGISVKEFNPSTMECRTVRGLYAAGEVLDVDAQTGGFNLQIAWSTGHLAGSSCGRAE